MWHIEHVKFFPDSLQPQSGTFERIQMNRSFGHQQVDSNEGFYAVVVKWLRLLMAPVNWTDGSLLLLDTCERST